MIKITAVLHASLVVSDLSRARDFYEGILGLVPDPARPDLGFAGVWYTIGAQQIHLLQLPSPEFGLERADHPGHDRHVALAVEDWDALQEKLSASNIPFKLSRSGRRAVFCRDPDGNGLELIAA